MQKSTLAPAQRTQQNVQVCFLPWVTKNLESMGMQYQQWVGSVRGENRFLTLVSQSTLIQI